MSRKPPLRLHPLQKMAHDQASAAGRDLYQDPASGMFVFTEHGLRRRGSCCGSACRHCPWDWQNVKARR